MAFESVNSKTKTGGKDGKPSNGAVQAKSALNRIIQMARMNPGALTRRDVAQLQRTLGNIAVCQLLTSQTVQMEDNEEEETVQGKFGTVQKAEDVQTKMENNTGLPDDLKTGVENLSGIDMSDVRVHYNSDKPAALGALAYTQGTDIHVAPGQEKHLPHEAWHVVQQAQGRVQPTMQMKGVAVNDDVGLEKEADEMGRKICWEKSDLKDKNVNRLISASDSQVLQRYLEYINGEWVENGRHPIGVKVPPPPTSPAPPPPPTSPAPPPPPTSPAPPIPTTSEDAATRGQQLWHAPAMRIWRTRKLFTEGHREYAQLPPAPLTATEIVNFRGKKLSEGVYRANHLARGIVPETERQAGGTCGLKAIERIFQQFGIKDENSFPIVVGKIPGINVSHNEAADNPIRSLLNTALRLKATFRGELLNPEYICDIVRCYGCESLIHKFMDLKTLKQIVDAYDSELRKDQVRIMIGYCFDIGNTDSRCPPIVQGTENRGQHWAVLEDIQEGYAQINEGNYGKYQVDAERLVCSSLSIEQSEISFARGTEDRRFARTYAGSCNIGGCVIVIGAPGVVLEAPSASGATSSAVSASGAAASSMR